jgi:hypothetical protein
MSLTFSAEENSSKVQVAPAKQPTVSILTPSDNLSTENLVISNGETVDGQTFLIVPAAADGSCATGYDAGDHCVTQYLSTAAPTTATASTATTLAAAFEEKRVEKGLGNAVAAGDVTTGTVKTSAFTRSGFSGVDGHNTNRSADFAMRMTYDVPGGHNLSVAGVLVPHTITKKSGATKNTTKYGWGIDAGGNLAVGDSITITAGVLYADGAGGYANFNTAPDAVVKPDGKVRLVSTLGVRAGVSLAVTDTTSINGGWGYVSNSKSDLNSSGVNGAVTMQRLHSVHGNLMWQPSSAMRFGWEIIWGRRVNLDGKKYDNLRGQFGAWFFF